MNETTRETTVARALAFQSAARRVRGHEVARRAEDWLLAEREDMEEHIDRLNDCTDAELEGMARAALREEDSLLAHSERRRGIR
jgi:hypothetical protein